MFKSMFRYIAPLFRTHALPVLKRGAQVIGSEMIKTASNIATDAIKGQNLKDSFQNHSSSAIENLANQAQSKLQSGSGRKQNGVFKKAFNRKLNILKDKIKAKNKKVKFSLNKPKIRRLDDIFS